MTQAQLARVLAIIDEIKDLLFEVFTQGQERTVEREPVAPEASPIEHSVLLEQPEPKTGRLGLAGAGAKKKASLPPSAEAPSRKLVACEVCNREIPSRAYQAHLENCSIASRGEYDEDSFIA
jgi:hypothetical protein